MIWIFMPVDEFITDTYIDSVLLAAKETGLDESAFPVECPLHKMIF
jgi:hypothetical protein